MKRTKVFANEEEKQSVIDLMVSACHTPVIAFSTDHALGHGGYAGDAMTRTRRACHALALKHGLPEIRGYYGMDCKTGEFVLA